MTISTGPTPHPVSGASRPPASFDPRAALAALDVLITRRPAAETSQAWDAAWIACMTNSPRWAEAARLAFARVMTAEG